MQYPAVVGDVVAAADATVALSVGVVVKRRGRVEQARGARVVRLDELLQLLANVVVEPLEREDTQLPTEEVDHVHT